MSCFDILENIENGSLHATKDIYPVIENECSQQKFSQARIKQSDIYHEILDYIEQGDVAGNKEVIGKFTHYSNLRLTEEGKELLRFSKLTIKDIDNSHGKNSIKEWLLKPLVLATCKYVLIGLLALIGGAYSSDIKDMIHKRPTQNQAEKPEQNK